MGKASKAKSEFIKVGIIGFGGAGMAHFKYFRHIPGTAVTAIFDTEPDALTRAEKLTQGVVITDDFRVFLKSNIDAVSICSPDSTHSDYILRSLESGRHVLCEKPLTNTINSSRSLLLSLKRFAGKRVVAVQHQMRFVRLNQSIKAIISRGILGDICYLEGYYVHDLRQRAFKFHNWRLKENATPMIYCGCHIADLLNWFLQDVPCRVTALANHRCFPEYPESDCNAALIEYRSGTIGHILVSLGVSRPQDHSVRIFGSKGCIDNNLLFEASGKKRILTNPRIYGEVFTSNGLRSKMRGIRRNVAAWMVGYLSHVLTKIHYPSYYDFVSFPLRLYEHQEACIACIQDFVDSIRQNRAPRVSAKEAAIAVAVCAGAVDSFRRGGQPVDVESIVEEFRGLA